MSKRKSNVMRIYNTKKIGVFYRGRVRYDLTKAELIAEYWNQIPTCQPGSYKENLFVTDNKNFVLYGVGNRESKYGYRRADGVYQDGSKYTVLSRTEAYDYLEERDLLDDVTVKRFFFDLVTEG